MDGKTTSLSLLDRAKIGQNDAWSDVQELYRPLVYYWLRQRMIRGQDLETLQGCVFSRAYLRMNGFEHNGRRGAFRMWLKKLTISEVADYFGKDRVGLPDGRNIPASREGPEDVQAVSAETAILAHRAWELVGAEFSDRDQQIFQRVKINGESAKHVSEDLGLSANNVYQIVFRITKRLNGRFSGELD